MPSLLPLLLTGLIFGLTLQLSCISRPSLLISQFRLTSYHVLTTYLIASACSTLIVYTSNSFGYVGLSPRSPSSYGWFGRYDANVVGGVLQGVGMAMTGLDPGTALVRLVIADGDERASAGIVVLGGLVGGLVFVALGSRLKRLGNVQRYGNLGQGKNTLPSWLGVREDIAVVGYEALLLVAVAWLGGIDTVVGPWKDSWADPAVSGLMIGAAQASSIALARRTIGISSAYSELAGHIASLLRGQGLNGGLSNVVFAVGVMLGAKLASQYVQMAVEVGFNISIGTALIGGFCTIFGARLAGGCTSGHGISGTSLLSISSFVTMVGLVCGGITCRTVLDLR